MTGQASEALASVPEVSRPDIEIRDLVKIFPTKAGSVIALDHVSFSVEKGGFVSLLGPSGCGKSTILHLVTGLLRPTAGEVFLGGRAVSKPQTDLGMVFQTDVLLEWRTALSNVMLPADAGQIDRRTGMERARELLASVGLDGFEDKLPHELSGGMRQRVAICRALLANPPRLLMDEPFGALDAITRDQLGLDLQRLWTNDRKTVLFVTHSIEEAVFLSDTVVVMTPRPGRIDDVVTIDLPRPRRLSVRESPEFGAHTTHIRELFLERGVLIEERGG